MTFRRKNKTSPGDENMASKSSTRKTSTSPVKEKGKNKRKRDAKGSTSPTVSPPQKTTRASQKEDTSSPTPSTSRASRSKASQQTPNKVLEESPKTAGTRSNKKSSPAATVMPSPARPTRATRASKSSPATPPTITPKSSPRTPRRSTTKVSESNSTPKSSPKVTKTSPARTPRSSRRSTVMAEANASKQDDKNVKDDLITLEGTPKSTPVTGRNKKRKKGKSPSISPTVSISPAKDEEPQKTDSTSNKSTYKSEELSPTNRSNRRKRRKGGGEVEEETVALSDGASDTIKIDTNKDLSDSKPKESNDLSESVEKKEAYQVTATTSTETKISESIENKVPLLDKSPVKPSRKLRVQSSETCRTAALCSIPSTAEISKYSNHSSHTNGNSSGIKRRLSNGNDSDSETTDWTTKKQKPEVLIAGSDDGDVVCGAVPLIHMKTLGSPCKSSVNRTDLYEELSSNVSDSGLTSPTSSSTLRGNVSNQSSTKTWKSSTNSLSSNQSTRNNCESSGSRESVNQSSSITPSKSQSIAPSTSRNTVDSLVSSGETSKTNTITTDIKYKNTVVHNKFSASSSSLKKAVVEEEMVCDANSSERLLSKFGLNNNQIKEITEILPESLRDGSELEILETLVEKLLEETRILKTMNAPRLNKLLRQLLTHFCSLDTSVEKKHAVCETALSWAKERKTINLRHELELTLMQLYYQTSCYRKAEVTANALYKETKKLQDKEKTVKACLCLSKTYHAMGNISKARANITTAKTEALKIYTPPDLQAELDLQSGILQVAEEKDMETAFSYFKEAATGSNNNKQRSRALKYMLLAKLMVNKSEDGEKAVRSSSHINDIDTGVEALIAITKAATSCSLADFKKARCQYKEELDGDIVVSGVLDHLYTKMMEKNLTNIIMPYERVQISFVADRIGLQREEVERRLSQMILDGELSAQLDHRDDCLYVYRPEPKDAAYSRSIDTIKELDKTLSHLNRRVKQLL